MRLFVALVLPVSHREALAFACEEGKRGGVRWVAARNVHLTLKFLGEVEEDKAEALKTALGAVAAASPPVTLSLAGRGCFPNARAPRVVWLGVGAGAAEVTALAEAVDEATSALGFEREKRRFKPHLTIGRLKKPKAGARVVAGKLEALRGFATPPAVAPALTLVKSTLTPAGSIYDELARFELAGGG
jgi:2'-5' RNA ligase